MSDQIPSAWERQPDESQRAFEVFRRYLEAGPRRSLEKLGKVVGYSSERLRQLREQNDWVVRAASYDAWMNQKAIEADTEATAERGRSIAQRRMLVAESLISQAEKMRDQLTEAMSRPLKGEELTLGELDKVLGMWERFVAVAGPLVGIVQPQAEGQPAVNVNLFGVGGRTSLNPDRMTREEVNDELLDRILDAGMRSVMGDEQAALPEHDDEEAEDGEVIDAEDDEEESDDDRGDE